MLERCFRNDTLVYIRRKKCPTLIGSQSRFLSYTEDSNWITGWVYINNLRKGDSAFCIVSSNQTTGKNECKWVPVYTFEEVEFSYSTLVYSSIALARCSICVSRDSKISLSLYNTPEQLHVKTLLLLERCTKLLSRTLFAPRYTTELTKEVGRLDSSDLVFIDDYIGGTFTQLKLYDKAFAVLVAGKGEPSLECSCFL